MDRIEWIITVWIAVAVIFLFFLLGAEISGDYHQKQFCEYLNATFMDKGYCLKDGLVIQVCEGWLC